MDLVTVVTLRKQNKLKTFYETALCQLTEQSKSQIPMSKSEVLHLNSFTLQPKQHYLVC